MEELFGQSIIVIEVDEVINSSNRYEVVGVWAKKRRQIARKMYRRCEAINKAT